MVGISEHCGNALTYKVFNPVTKKVLHRSACRPALPPDTNLRAELLGGESDDIVKPVLHSRYDNVSDSKQHTTSVPAPPPLINAEDLIGRTIMLDKQLDGQQFRARIVKLIQDHTSNIENDKERVKFMLRFDHDQREEIITYNQLLDYISQEQDDGIVWKFRRIVSHQGPLPSTHKDYNGSAYNLLIEWENGETTYEPLSIIGKDDPVTCAIYAKEHGLLNLPGWKQFKSIARREKKFTRMVNQAKLKSYNRAPIFKNGFEVPRTYEQAVLLDKRNGNTKFQDAAALELQQMKEYETFKDHGHHTKAKIPPGYKKSESILSLT